MSKAIMISIQPKWCELIASGEKTIEVRKTRPKLPTPFKCYIYCTKSKIRVFLEGAGLYCYEDDLAILHRPGMPRISNPWGALDLDEGEMLINGKVIGEFVCDEIIEYSCIWGLKNGEDCDYSTCSFDEDYTCLTEKQMGAYGRGKPLYGWHISDLKIYDTPKELSEFVRYCGDDCPNEDNCEYIVGIRGYEYDERDCACNFYKPLSRPPQSWCYVEEV